MADPRAKGVGEGSSSHDDKGKGKLVFPSDISMDIPLLCPSKVERYERLAESLHTTELESRKKKFEQSSAKEEVKEEDLQGSEWENPVVIELVRLILPQLREAFKTAINKLVECGYTEKLAEWAVLKKGVCVGNKDIISNIVDGALVQLNKGREDCDATTEPLPFGGVDSMADISLVEMVNVLRDIKPHLSLVEAMWVLLISDMNLFHAQAREEQALNLLRNQEKETENQCCSKLSYPETEGTSAGENSGAAGRGTSMNSRKDLLLQKAAPHCEKGKKDSTVNNVQSTQSGGPSGAKKKKKKNRKGSKAAAVLKQQSQPGNSSAAEISADEVINVEPPQTIVPRTEEDELAMKLTLCKEELEKQLQGWTDWTSVKVKETAQKLTKNQAELKMLRQEKLDEAEKSRKAKAVQDEATKKRTSEVEGAIKSVEGQIETDSSAVHRLKAEQTTLRKGLVDSKLKSVNSSKTLQDAKLGEQEMQKQCRNLEREMSHLQGDLAAKKEGETSHLQAQIEKAAKRQQEFEVLREHEEREKAKLLAQAESIERETRQLMQQAKEEEDHLTAKAEANRLMYEEQKNKLNAEISALKLKREVASKGKSTKRDRECVMCLTEERSVVFLDCAHQVLCKECNVLHEKKGMNDCPVCRRPILRRISPRFVPPGAR